MIVNLLSPIHPLPFPPKLTNTAVTTQLYSVPPWAAAFGFSMLIAYLSDRLRHRFAFTILTIVIAISGIGVLLNIHGAENNHIQYGCLFLVTCGCYTAMPLIVCWYAMNLSGHRRRSVGTAYQIGFGNSTPPPPLFLPYSSFPAVSTNCGKVGGIISSYSFRAEDAPQYRPGYIIGLSFICLSGAMCIVYFFACWHENRKRDRADVVQVSEEEEEDLGDLAPSYRYTY